MRERTIKKQFWLNQNEDTILKEKSKRSNLNESEFLRSCIKGYTIKEQPNEEIKEFLKQLSGIANNINQIARAYNTDGYARNNILYIKTILERFILNFEKEIYSRR